MREIKFRAWSKLNKCMLLQHRSPQSHPQCTVWKNAAETLIYDFHTITGEYCIPLRFTGLHDKAGNEAYHKDVAEYIDDSDTPRVGVIEWSDTGAYFYLEAIGGDDEGNQDGDMTYRKFNIIGNIFENPELLKES